MESFNEIYINLREGERINNYLDSLLLKIATKYFEYTALIYWKDNTWEKHKINIENRCKEIYNLEKGYWNTMIFDMDKYINSWFTEPKWLEISINLREFINILHIYNKIQYLKLKNNNSKKEKKLLKELNKKISITEYLIKLNEFFYPPIDIANINYYQDNSKIFKELKTFLSEPLHAYSVFYKNSFNGSKELEEFIERCKKHYTSLLDKILENESIKYNRQFGLNIMNTSFFDFGAFFNPVQVSDFRDLLNIRCISLLDVLLNKFDANIEAKIIDYKKTFNK